MDSWPPLDLEDNIADCLKRLEDKYKHSLPDVEREFIIVSIRNFVSSAIEKYILGSKEHGNPEVPEETFLNSVDHLTELGNEIPDLFWYHAAAKYKLSRKS